MPPRASSRPRGESSTSPEVWAVGGGKGGVGKSFLAANMGILLAKGGRRVVLLDGDLGGANLDAFLGCPRPLRTLSHFFSRDVAQLSDIAMTTGVDGLSLIAGDAETLGSANPAHGQKLKLIRHLKRLDADIVIIDLGAGTSFNTLDLFIAADMGLAVTTPEPTAIQNCFAFIKAITLRDLEKRTGVQRRKIDRTSLRQSAAESPEARAALDRSTRLVVNRSTAAESRRVANLLHDLAARFLGGRVVLAGSIPDDASVVASVRDMQPLVLRTPAAPAAIELGHILAAIEGPSADSSCVGNPGGLNEEIQLAGRRLHLQSEDLGAAQGAIRTQLFAPDGSVVYTRRTPYVDAFFIRLAVGPNDRVRYHHVAIRRALEQGRLAFGADARQKTA